MNLKKLIVLLMLCLLFSGCKKPQDAAGEQKDKKITELSIPGLVEFCVDAAGEYCYYAVNGESMIYKCAVDGTPVTQFAITADESYPDTQNFFGEQPPEAVNLSGLCLYGDTLYCFRGLKSTLLAVDVTTGEQRVLDTLEGFYTVLQMSAGETTLMLPCFTEAGKQFFVYHLNTGMMEKVPVEGVQNFAYAGGDSYWLNVKDEDGTYYFQKYHAVTGDLSEEYVSNFTYELTDMSYDAEKDLLYGRMYSVQYLCFHPKEPQKVSRFTSQKIYQSPASMQIRGDRLYTLDTEKGKLYHFNPEAYVTWNQPLKGYVTSELAVSEWAGYNIDLEVIDWEELALKVLAEDRDYDFVIMNTTMAEAVALRDAMAYLPIPEETVENYWAECWPCVREGASHNGDIWMLPLEIYARGLVYSEQNLAKYGLSMENIKTMLELCEAAKVLHGGGEAGWYNLQPMQNHLLQEYVWKQQDAATMNFDTPEFRSIMEFIREEYKNNDYSPAYYRNSYININSSGMEYDSDSALTYDEQLRLHYQRQAANIYFDETSDYDAYSYTKYAGAEGLRVRTVPGMFGTEETAQINGTFLVLNPNSENREELLNFVSAMSEAYIANPETWLSSNQERYATDLVTQDVCSLYRNGEMVFGMPDGLFTSYYQYVMGNGELSADEVVKELNRVVNMYYGE